MLGAGGHFTADKLTAPVQLDGAVVTPPHVSDASASDCALIYELITQMDELDSDAQA